MVKSNQFFFEALRNLTPGEKIEIEKREHCTLIRYYRAENHVESNIPNEALEIKE